jgi:hypothetical protein
MTRAYVRPLAQDPGSHSAGGNPMATFAASYTTVEVSGALQGGHACVLLLRRPRR